ncbi:hybrid sensor histidine kinase/response regulator [Pantanalinema sp. GBBB05]|uniref:hybrid sensor histidine kinase/response regulator n=1 Tax=Pantanalinema sp. GBBB05 TaxID=2604139 RepID=UPI001D415CE4|nr:hybrid sensor histidine kinase/response regulator [Pantanalinema sp. GBBB05]
MVTSDQVDTKASILIVDDQPDNLRALSAILQYEGFKVRKAVSGTMALETIHAQLPDLLLLDIRMPQMDGFEVCTTLKQSVITADIPIIFLSASDDIEDKVRAFEMGGCDYITKPFRSPEVLARINHQLTIQQQHRRLAELYHQVQYFNHELEQQVQERTQDLEQALEELHLLNQLRDDFLSTISHELRTPLTNIRMVVQMLMIATQHGQTFFEKISEAAPKQKITQYLTILQDECDRELQLVEDLLDLQNLTTDDLPLSLTTINLYDWLPLVLNTFQTRLTQRQQALVVELAADLPLLNTDVSSLNRVVTELLTNACKYTPAGERITVTAKVIDQQKVGQKHAFATETAISVKSSPPATIEISVTNTGVEIPPSDSDRIFDTFYRVLSTDPWKHGGTGLGLALVKRLVEHLQGSIRVTSYNNTTCFTIELPVLPV